MGEFWLSRDEVRELDRRAIEEYGVPGVVLMENAGRGCAELLMRLNPEKRPVVILCGPGNNGGDGFVIARHLDNHGWRVGIELFASEDKLSPDAATNLRPLKGWVELTSHGRLGTADDPNPRDVVQRLAGMFRTKTWIVDALFGTGLSRRLEGPYAEVVATINASRTPVVSIDIPSGLDCDTGEPLGPTVRATHTATFVAPKMGFLNPTSRDWTGEVHVIDIGAPRKPVDEFRAIRTK